MIPPNKKLNELNSDELDLFFDDPEQHSTLKEEWNQLARSISKFDKFVRDHFHIEATNNNFGVLHFFHKAFKYTSGYCVLNSQYQEYFGEILKEESKRSKYGKEKELLGKNKQQVKIKRVLIGQELTDLYYAKKQDVIAFAHELPAGIEAALIIRLALFFAKYLNEDQLNTRKTRTGEPFIVEIIQDAEDGTKSARNAIHEILRNAKKEKKDLFLGHLPPQDHAKKMVANKTSQVNAIESKENETSYVLISPVDVAQPQPQPSSTKMHEKIAKLELSSNDKLILPSKEPLIGALTKLKEYTNKQDFRRNEKHREERLEHIKNMWEAAQINNNEAAFNHIRNNPPSVKFGVINFGKNAGTYHTYLPALNYQMWNHFKNDQEVQELVLMMLGKQDEIAQKRIENEQQKEVERQNISCKDYVDIKRYLERVRDGNRDISSEDFKERVIWFSTLVKLRFSNNDNKVEAISLHLKKSLTFGLTSELGWSIYNLNPIGICEDWSVEQVQALEQLAENALRQLYKCEEAAQKAAQESARKHTVTVSGDKTVFYSWGSSQTGVAQIRQESEKSQSGKGKTNAKEKRGGIANLSESIDDGKSAEILERCGLWDNGL